MGYAISKPEAEPFTYDGLQTNDPTSPSGSHDQSTTADNDIFHLTKLRSEPCDSTRRAALAGRQLPLSPVRMLLGREAKGRFSTADRSYVLGRYLPTSGPSPIDRMDTRAYVSQFSADGSLFIAGFQGSRIRIYDVDNGWKVQKDVLARNLRWTITDTALSPDQRFLVYASMSPIVHIVNVGNTGTESYANVTDIHDGLDLSLPGFGAHAFGVFSVKFSVDGRELVAGSSDDSIYVYDLDADKLASRFEAHASDVNTVTFADESGNLIYSGSDDYLCKVLQIQSRHLLRIGLRSRLGLLPLSRATGFTPSRVPETGDTDGGEDTGGGESEGGDESDGGEDEDDDEGNDGHDGSPPGGSFVQREGKAPAFEVRPLMAEGSAPPADYSLGDPEVVRSLMTAMVTPAYSRSLGWELLHDPGRLQDVGIAEVFGGLLKMVLAQRQGVPLGGAGAGSSGSAELQEALRRAEAAETEVVVLRDELAEERRLREETARELESRRQSASLLEVDLTQARLELQTVQRAFTARGGEMVQMTAELTRLESQVAALTAEVARLSHLRDSPGVSGGTAQRPPTMPEPPPEGGSGI